MGLTSSVSGTLFIEIGDVYFPAHGWGDFVVPVLDWWMEEAMKLTLPGVEARNIFMDGPYAFSLCRVPASGIVTLFLYRDGKTIFAQFTIDYGRYLATLRGAGKSVLRDVETKGYRGHGEVESLLSRLDQLMRLESDIKHFGLA